MPNVVEETPRVVSVTFVLFIARALGPFLCSVVAGRFSQPTFWTAFVVSFPRP